LRTILTAVIAAIAAYGINTFIISKLGLAVLIDLVPMVEESLKTGLAVFNNVNILIVHFLFGLIEGISDFKAGERNAALLSLGSHFLFGFMAWLLWLTLGLGWAVFGCSILHMTYNRWVLSQ